MNIKYKIFLLAFTTFLSFEIGPTLGFIDESQLPVNIYYFESDLSGSTEPVVEKKKENMTCGDLGIDQSCIVIESNVDKIIKFFYASMECEKCQLEELAVIKPLSSFKTIIKFASLGSVWKITNKNNETLCRQEEKYLGENSWYHIYVNDSGCSLVQDQEPNFIYYPIFIAIGIYFLLAVLWILGNYLKRSEILNGILRRDSLDVSAELAAAYSSSGSGEDVKKTTQKRLKSLDTVRGISIVVMIFVNYGGGRYSFFEHSIWNGLTVADLVFPWFMWMMGMSMALSMRSLLRKAVPRKKIFKKIVMRSIILFSLGIMLNTYCLNVNLQNIRIPGVLQRFSITYLVVASVHLFYASANDDQVPLGSYFRDITPYGGEWLIMLMCLVLHVLLMFFVHSPHCPAGYFGPGGLHYGGKYSLCTGGAAGYVDRAILGDNHLYQHASIKAIYHNTLPHDPEGIIGYLTSTFLVFLGLQAGKILLTYKEWKARVIRWMLWACLTGAVAALLCLCSKNDGYIPINKNLWSVSFILATGSLAFLLISICYFVIDVKNWWNGAPFFYAGMNSILLYVGHEITTTMFPWSWEIEPTHMNELFQDLLGTTLWVLIAIRMYRKKFFLAI